MFWCNVIFAQWFECISNFVILNHLKTWWDFLVRLLFWFNTWGEVVRHGLLNIEPYFLCKPWATHLRIYFVFHTWVSGKTHQYIPYITIFKTAWGKHTISIIMKLRHSNYIETIMLVSTVLVRLRKWGDKDMGNRFVLVQLNIVCHIWFIGNHSYLSSYRYG
jgi:hypothetical protein